MWRRPLPQQRPHVRRPNPRRGPPHGAAARLVPRPCSYTRPSKSAGHQGGDGAGPYDVTPQQDPQQPAAAPPASPHSAAPSGVPRRHHNHHHKVADASAACVSLAVLLTVASRQAGLAWLLLASAVATAGLSALMVPVLRRLRAGQVLKPLPQLLQHHGPKAGTPTMGGLALILAPLGVLAASGALAAPAAAAVAVAAVAFMAVGAVDDLLIVKQRSNKGLAPAAKLLCQALIAAAFCWWTAHSAATTPLSHGELSLGPSPGHPGAPTAAAATAAAPALGAPWHMQVRLPAWAYWPLAAFAIVAESNGANITDGLDGLAAGVAAVGLAGLALATSTVAGTSELCATVAGGCIGFLAVNRHPARLFMGDTGALALGGCMGCVAVACNALPALALLTLPFAVEAASSLAQIMYKRATGGRKLLLMAPLHHHLELLGWHETAITAAGYAAALASLALAWLLGALRARPPLAP